MPKHLISEHSQYCHALPKNEVIDYVIAFKHELVVALNNLADLDSGDQLDAVGGIMDDLKAFEIHMRYCKDLENAYKVYI